MKKQSHQNNEKYIFRLNVWITGMYNNFQIIGRTCIVNNKQMIMCIDENSSPKLINFNDVINLGKINFIEKSKQIPNLIQNKIPQKIPRNQLINFIGNSKN